MNFVSPQIYAMTLRLSAMFEDHIKDIINDWKRAMKYERTGRVPKSVVSTAQNHQNDCIWMLFVPLKFFMKEF